MESANSLLDYETDDEELDDEDGVSQGASDSSEEFRGLVGLQNLGNTCYMNGALQALSNCQQLTRFVLDCPGFMRGKGLSQSYSDLIKEIWISNNRSFAVPTSIIRNIKCIYPAFRGCTQQDTQEFLRCFLEQLHDELKQPVIENGGRCSGQRPEVEGNGLERDVGNSDVFINDCNKEGDNIKESNLGESSRNLDSNIQRSIISDTFEFKISSSVVCSNCNNVSTTRETFKDLSVPIPPRDHPYYQACMNNENLLNPSNRATSERLSSSDSDTRKRTPSIRSTLKTDENDIDSADENANDSCQELQTSYFGSMPLFRWFWDWLSQLGNWFWGPQVTLQDCLSIFFGSDPLEGDNEYSCEVCTKKNKGVKYLKILELPEVLCIHFKRYESIGSSKITTHVSFPLVGLDLAPFMSENSRPQCTTYNLIACICHHGSALLTGHYTTYALNCYDDQWYEFDDLYVTGAQSYQVENSEAYILFYQKSSPNDKADRQRMKASRLLRKSLSQENMKKYFISKQWVNKFNTFVEPGPITNYDFLCEHKKVPKSRQPMVSELCHPISEAVWNYLRKLHGGGPECRELTGCDVCE